MSNSKKINSKADLPGIDKPRTYSTPKENKDEKPESPKGKFKRSGHLGDQVLKYNSTNKDQLSLFDSLKTETIEHLEVAGVEVSEAVEGIRLTGSETKIIDSISKLLHDKSQNIDPSKLDYYSGNNDVQMIPYEGEKTPLPKIFVTLYDLTKEYKGGEYVSGKDLENVSKTLQILSSKKFLLRYKEVIFKKDGSRSEKQIETFRNIIDVPNLQEREFNKEGIEISKKEEKLIILHPIFRRQIDTKFILYPEDITKRTVIAYGSHNLSEGVVRLRDWLMREKSYKHYKPEIYLHNLLDLVAEKYMRNSRKARAKSILNKSIETMITMGLIHKTRKTKGASGEEKVIFYINEDWE